MYIKERNWKIKYINLLRFGWSSVSERISFVHHGAHVFAQSAPENCVWLVGYLPGLIGSLISEITVCIAVNGMEVTGALQERTRSVDRNTNCSSDPIRLPGPPDPRDFLRVSWEAVCGWYCTDLCDRESHTSRPKNSPCPQVPRKWFPEPLFGSCQCGAERFLFLLNILPWFFFFFKHLDAL